MQVDIVNTFERKMNPKCLPKHRKVGFLGAEWRPKQGKLASWSYKEGA